MKNTALSAPPYKPALRLVSTKGMAREDWLTVRKTGIGSSDAAAAVGLNPYQSRLELWMIKTGKEHLLPKIDPDDETSPMYWGSLLEPIVAEHYTKRTGHKVRRVNAVLQHPDSDKSWMLANIDYAVVGSDEVYILECKTAGEFGSRLWREGVPEYVQCQVQHQLAVTGKAAADVCVLVCGQEIRVFRIHRDEELIQNLISLEREFWHLVETNTPPLADSSHSAGQALQCLFPSDNGSTVDFKDDESLCLTFDHLMAVKAQLQHLSESEAELKHTLQQQMGDATTAHFESGSVSWKRSKDGVSLDTEALLTENPGLIKQYPKPRNGSRRFLVRT